METHEAEVGSLLLSITDKETVNVPIWAGVGTIVLGGLLLVFGSRKSWCLTRQMLFGHHGSLADS